MNFKKHVNVKYYSANMLYAYLYYFYKHMFMFQ